MNVSYKKLWKLIIDKEMTNVEVRKATGIRSATFTKLKKNEAVSLDILLKLCKYLECNIGNICSVLMFAGKQERNLTNVERNKMNCGELHFNPNYS